MCSELRKKSQKKIKKTFNHDISPLCRGAPAGPTFTVFGVWGQIPDVITHVKFQIDWSRGLGATGAQNRVSYSLSNRSHSSVMHYRATL